MTADLCKPLPVPIGWLVHPEGEKALLFIRDPKSLMRMTKVITQLWCSTSDGVPIRIKNTRTLELEDACETWNELLGNGWVFVQRQINDVVSSR